MSLINGLISELQTLSSDSKRKNPEVRVASEEAITTLRTLFANKNTVNNPNISSKLIAENTDMLRPINVAAHSSNSQRYLCTVVAILYRLVIHNALPINSGSKIISIEKDKSTGDPQGTEAIQGVPSEDAGKGDQNVFLKVGQVLDILEMTTQSSDEIQLKGLQCIMPLITQYSSFIHQESLFRAYGICFCLQQAKSPTVVNAGVAIIRQLVIYLFEQVKTESLSSLSPSLEITASESPNFKTCVTVTRSNDGDEISMKPFAADAYFLLQDICQFLNGDKPARISKLSLVSIPFALELIESVLSSNSAVFLRQTEFLSLLNNRLCVLIISLLKMKNEFGTTCRLYRVISLFLLEFYNLVVNPALIAEFSIKIASVTSAGCTIWQQAMMLEVIRDLFSNEMALNYYLSCLSSDFQNSSKVPIVNLIISINQVSSKILNHLTAKEILDYGTLQLKLPLIQQLDRSNQSTSFNSSALGSISIAREAYLLTLSYDCIVKIMEYILSMINSHDSNITAKMHHLSVDISNYDSQSNSVQANSCDQNDSKNKEKDNSMEKKILFAERLMDTIHLSMAEALFSLLNDPRLSRNWAQMILERISDLAALLSRLSIIKGLDFLLENLSHSAISFSTSPSSVTPLNLAVSITILSLAKSKDHIDLSGGHCWIYLMRVLLACERLLSLPVNTLTAIKKSITDSIISDQLQLSMASSQLESSIQQPSSRSAISNFFAPLTGSAAGSSTGSNFSGNNSNIGSKKGAAGVPSSLGPSTIDIEGLREHVFSVIQSLCDGFLDSTCTLSPLAFESLLSACMSLVQKNHAIDDNQTALLHQQAVMLKVKNIALANISRFITTGTSEATQTTNALDQSESTECVDENEAKLESFQTKKDLITSKPTGWNLLMQHIRQTAQCELTQTQACGTASMIVSVLPKTANSMDKCLFENNRVLQLRALEPLICLLGGGNVAPGSIVTPTGSILSISEYYYSSSTISQNETAEVDVDVENRGVDQSNTKGPSVEVRRAALDSLLGYLEHFGPSIKYGWSIIFSIIDHCLIDFAGPPHTTTKNLHTKRELDPSASNSTLNTDIIAREQSIGLVKAAFSCVKLVCTHLLPALSNQSICRIVAILSRRFALYSDDLNMSLASIGLLWDVADHVRGLQKPETSGGSSPVTPELSLGGIDFVIQEPLWSQIGSTTMIIDHSIAMPRPLWVEIISNLVNLTADVRPEIRDSAIQTVTRAIGICGPALNFDEWEAVLEAVVVPCIECVSFFDAVGAAEQSISQEAMKPAPLISRYQSKKPSSNQSSSLSRSVSSNAINALGNQATGSSENFYRPSRSELIIRQWMETRILLLEGLAEVLKRHAPPLFRLPNFCKYWSRIMETLVAFCEAGVSGALLMSKNFGNKELQSSKVTNVISVAISTLNGLVSTLMNEMGDDFIDKSKFLTSNLALGTNGCILNSQSVKVSSLQGVTETPKVGKTKHSNIDENIDKQAFESDEETAITPDNKHAFDQEHDAFDSIVKKEKLNGLPKEAKETPSVVCAEDLLARDINPKELLDKAWYCWNQIGPLIKKLGALDEQTLCVFVSIYKPLLSIRRHLYFKDFHTQIPWIESSWEVIDQAFSTYQHNPAFHINLHSSSSGLHNLWDSPENITSLSNLQRLVLQQLFLLETDGRDSFARCVLLRRLAGYLYWLKPCNALSRNKNDTLCWTFGDEKSQKKVLGTVPFMMVILERLAQFLSHHRWGLDPNIYLPFSRGQSLQSFEIDQSESSPAEVASQTQLETKKMIEKTSSAELKKDNSAEYVSANLGDQTKEQPRQSSTFDIVVKAVGRLIVLKYKLPALPSSNKIVSSSEEEFSQSNPSIWSMATRVFNVIILSGLQFLDNLADGDDGLIKDLESSGKKSGCTVSEEGKIGSPVISCSGSKILSTSLPGSSGLRVSSTDFEQEQDEFSSPTVDCDYFLENYTKDGSNVDCCKSNFSILHQQIWGIIVTVIIKILEVNRTQPPPFSYQFSPSSSPKNDLSNTKSLEISRSFPESMAALEKSAKFIDEAFEVSQIDFLISRVLPRMGLVERDTVRRLLNQFSACSCMFRWIIEQAKFNKSPDYNHSFEHQAIEESSEAQNINVDETVKKSIYSDGKKIKRPSAYSILDVYPVPKEKYAEACLTALFSICDHRSSSALANAKHYDSDFSENESKKSDNIIDAYGDDLNSADMTRNDLASADEILDDKNIDDYYLAIDSDEKIKQLPIFIVKETISIILMESVTILETYSRHRSVLGGGMPLPRLRQRQTFLYMKHLVNLRIEPGILCQLIIDQNFLNDRIKTLKGNPTVSSDDPVVGFSFKVTEVNSRCSSSETQKNSGNDDNSHFALRRNDLLATPIGHLFYLYPQLCALLHLQEDQEISPMVKRAFSLMGIYLGLC